MSTAPHAEATTAFPDDLLVCRCEGIAAGPIRIAIAAGAISLNDVKRRTRAGMGVCQGIFCTRAIALMIESQADVHPERIVPMTARPPARVISLAALAAAVERQSPE